MKKLLFAAILLLGTVGMAWGDTHTAASASLADVTTAYNASATGDTVKITGNATWTSGLAILKKVTVLGVSCTLTSNISTSSTEGVFTIRDIAIDTLLRITGISFVSNIWTTPGQAIFVRNTIGCFTSKMLRIDHCSFKNYGHAVMCCEIRGVTDHCSFIDCNIGWMQITQRACGDSAWKTLSAGTDTAFFIEDNYFGYTSEYPSSTVVNENIGTAGAGKLVIRNNVFRCDSMPYKDPPIIMSPIGPHGNYSAGGPGVGYWEGDEYALRGPPVIEIYNNIYYVNGVTVTSIISSRGGSIIAYNNTISGITKGTSPSINYAEEEYYSSAFSINRTAWPAEDQVHNSFTWNNVYRGHDMNDGVYGSITLQPGDSLAGLLLERDFHLHAPIQNDGYEYYTGKNGSSNTNPTDGDPYSTQGTLLWSKTGDNFYYGYKAYKYPHQLVGNRQTVITVTR
jgi:hypothetical protein